jgi:predicted transcriptional regulator
LRINLKQNELSLKKRQRDEIITKISARVNKDMASKQKDRQRNQHSIEAIKKSHDKLNEDVN